MRISETEDLRQSQQSRLAELEADCETAEAQGDDSAYEEAERRYYQVESNIELLEVDLNDLNSLLQ